jgi:hypothetical protein
MAVIATYQSIKSTLTSKGKDTILLQDGDKSLVMNSNLTLTVEGRFIIVNTYSMMVGNIPKGTHNDLQYIINTFNSIQR